MTAVRVESAAGSDLEALRALLRAAELPTDGVSDELIPSVLITRDGSRIVGCVALELYDDAAVLRSLAVTLGHRGRGLGRELTGAALDLARQRGVRTVYLLTMTAREFFAEKFDFRPIPRGEVPPTVQRSVEFVSACPASAETMVRVV